MVSGRTWKAVASQWRPVDPEGTQGRYIRSRTALQDSEDLRKYQNCVAEEMEGASGSRSDIRSAFEDAADECS